MATIHRLQPRFVKAVTAKGMYPDGGGLYLQVGEGGRAKSWLFRYSVDGIERQMGLGPVHTIGLVQVRELARQAREQRLNGIDPIEARNASRLDQKLATAREVTFRHCAEGWMAARERGWSAGYAKTVVSLLQRFVYPILGHLPVQKVNVDLVHKTLAWLHKEHPPTYTNAQMYIEGTLNWARAKGYVTGDNPASLKGPLQVLLDPVKKIHTVKHHESLPHKKIGEFMAELRTYNAHTDPHASQCSICTSPHREEIEAAQREGVAVSKIAARFGLDLHNAWQIVRRHEQWRGSGGIFSTRPIAAYALEFIVLTAVRREQGASARWDHIDFEDRIWICPPESHKTGKKTGESHIVPLSDAAMAILAEMKEIQKANGQDSEFVFAAGLTGMKSTATGHLGPTMINRFMTMYLKRTDCVPHGFRTTFKEWAGEHNYDENDSEMALAHTVGNHVRNIYARNIKRIEPRRLMMQAWADYCGRTEPLDAKIISMRQAKNGETSR